MHLKRWMMGKMMKPSKQVLKRKERKVQKHQLLRKKLRGKKKREETRSY